MPRSGMQRPWLQDTAWQKRKHLCVQLIRPPLQALAAGIVQLTNGVHDACKKGNREQFPGTQPNIGFFARER